MASSVDQIIEPAKKGLSRTRKRGRGNTRDKIKAIATRLLIMRGIGGFSYADIAKRLDITTTNIHHHFGNKKNLVDEVVREYVADASLRHKQIWTDSSLTLAEKIEKFVAFNFERYSKFNKGARQGQPWSLIGRLRLDSHNLSPQSVGWLASFGSDVQAFMTTAVIQARDAGELAKEAPTKDIALLLANMVNSTAIFTQTAGSFSVVRDVFESANRVIATGYGTRGHVPVQRVKRTAS
jgi:TetR/AcrR family transcriptional regulator, transcriptional repressor for nem operon